jgi:DNA primase
LRDKNLVEEVAGEKREVETKDEISITTKYLVEAGLEVNGVVERPDVVGAIFGQTEGLLGEDLDLRELLRSGRIGRIRVNLKAEHGKTAGKILIPSSLDRYETAIIAAALETIERIGPCEATIKIEKIQDVRDSKRKFIVHRAKEILQLFGETLPETQEITTRVKETVKAEDVGEYHGVPAGPAVEESDAIIIVEGRADVLNLLRAGIKNTIAVEGTSVPKAVAELANNKTATAFLDNDRGGDLILKELLQVAKVDYIARAPQGKSVEDLTRKEIVKALKNKVPIDKALLGKPEERPRETGLEPLRTLLEELRGSLKAKLLDENFQVVAEIPVGELREKLATVDGVSAVVFDGIVTPELARAASEKNVRYLVGMRSRIKSAPPGMRVLTQTDFRYARELKGSAPW